MLSLNIPEVSLLSFARTLARFPAVILAVSGCLCLLLTLIGLLTTDWPDFSNPILGFNTTGTDISNKLLALHNLQNEIGIGKMFYQFPNENPKRTIRKEQKQKHKKQKTKKNRNQTETSSIVDGRINQRHSSLCNDYHCNKTDDITDPYYCAIELSDQHAHLVFELDNVTSWVTFQKLCDIEVLLWMPTNFRLIKRSNCQTNGIVGSCCQPWHLASVAAAMLGKSHCNELNATDFEIFMTWMNYCSAYKSQIIDCRSNYDNWEPCAKTQEIPKMCWSESYYHLFNYLIGKSYHHAISDEVSTDNSSDSKVNNSSDSKVNNSSDSKVNVRVYALMMLPVAKQTLQSDGTSLTLVKKLQKELASHEHVRLVGMDLGLRDAFFVQYLLYDTVYGALAVLLVLISMWLYTGSFLFTLASLVGILLSIGAAYFVYRIIFIDFFPFMNLLTFVLMVGLGADDTFIYRSAWIRAKSKKHVGTLPKVISDTLSHAAAAMLVTSLTTSAAFFSNFLSHIIVIKCFGVFAGITVITNYIVVITWLPAAIILIEKYDCSTSNVCQCCKVSARIRHVQPPSTPSVERRSGESLSASDNRRNSASADVSICCVICCRPVTKLYHNTVDCGKIFIEKLLPWLVIKFRYLWIVSFGALSIGAVVTVFYSPGLRLPDKDYFPYFKPSHPFERWENELRQEFVFSSSSYNQVPMLTRVIWGVHPTTDANYLNPDDYGSLHPWSNGSFEFDNNLALAWLHEFCSNLVMQNFTDFRGGPMLPYCFIDDFMKLMHLPCTDPAGKDRSPCCNKNPFPYPPGVFDECLSGMLTKFPNDIQRDLVFTRFRNGPFFSSESDRFGLLTVLFPSVYTFSLSYKNMNEYYTKVNGWISQELAKGPYMVRNGWFVSDMLHFYDLQKALFGGTQISVAVAVAVSFVVLFLTTLNLMITLLSVVSVSSVIFVTIACLIWMRWELNVLESTIIILTIGLSFDFTLHYGVAYKLNVADSSDREIRVVNTLSRTGGPVFMAMVTTFLAGLAMTPSTTLAYFQIGVFMMVVTLVSWLYATFFFCSFLYLIGPAGDRCQFRWSSLWRNRRKRRFSKAEMSGRKMSATRHVSISRQSDNECSTADVVEMEPMLASTKFFPNSASSHRKYSRDKSKTSIRRASMPVIRGIPSLIEHNADNGDTRVKVPRRMQSDLCANRIAFTSNI